MIIENLKLTLNFLAEYSGKILARIIAESTGWIVICLNERAFLKALAESRLKNEATESGPAVCVKDLYRRANSPQIYWAIKRISSAGRSAIALAPAKSPVLGMVRIALT